MLTPGNLALLEKFLLTEGRKSIDEHRCSAVDQHLDAEKSILDQLNPNNYDSHLIKSAGQGCVRVVHLLLDLGANKDAAGTNSLTGLMAAVIKEQVEVVRLLLQARVDIDARAINGATALMFATCKGDAVVVEGLLAAGAKVDAHKNNGRTALCLAVRESKEDEVIALLISYGANPFVRVENKFINNDPINPLTGYSEKILKYIALSTHTAEFCAAVSTDSPAVKAIKADMSKRRKRMNALRSIYQQELDCYRSTLALNTTAQSIHPSYYAKKITGHSLKDIEASSSWAEQDSHDFDRENRIRACSIVSLNMFVPVAAVSADDSNENLDASASRVRFFSQIRERVAVKYQTALAAKQPVQAGDVAELTVAESDAVVLQIEARLNQQKHRANAMNLTR